MLESRIGREMRDLGRMEARREDVLASLEERFGPEAARPFTEQVNAIEDLDQLNQLLRLAIRCTSPDEFRRGIGRRTIRRRGRDNES